jgi:hypothetical protein
VGGGIEEREHRVKMHRIAVKAVAMRSGKPGQLNGGSLNGSVFKSWGIHLFDYSLW